jgi:hypothetical protein
MASINVIYIKGQLYDVYLMMTIYFNNKTHIFEVEAIIGNKYDDNVGQIVVVYSMHTLI